MANLSNINNILRTDSLGVGINRDPLGVLEVSSATRSGIKMFNTGSSGRTYETYVDASGNYIIYDVDADRNDLVISDGGDATFAGSITAAGGTMTADTTFNSNIILEGNIFHKDDTNTYFGFNTGSSTDDVITFATNNVQRLTIDSSGNSTFAGRVGIGVTNNGGNGGLMVTTTEGVFSNADQKRVASFYDGSVNANNPGIVLGYDDSSTPHGIVAARTQTGSGTIPGLQFFTYDGGWGPRMTIDNNGKVGIGTTNPLYPLNVAIPYAKTSTGTQQFAAIFTTNEAASSAPFGLRIGIIGAAAIANRYAALQTTDYGLADDGNIVMQAAGGKVGIGGTSPATKLHVSNTAVINDAYGLALVENTSTGSGSAANSALNIKSKYGTSQFMQWEDHGLRIGSRIVDNGGAGDIIFTAGSDQERMRIDSLGQVGIGAPALPTDVYTGGGGYALLGMGQSSFLASYKNSPSIELCQNTYVNTSGLNTGVVASHPAARLTLVDGQFVFASLVTAANKSQTAINTLKIGTTGEITPGGDNTQNLGSSSIRWSVVYSANGVNTSDETLKENIKECDLGIDFINTLKPKSYNFKDLDKTHQDYGKKHYGLIAQDLKDGLLKDSVDGEKDGEYGLMYNDLIAPMIKAIQELKADNDILKSRIETLENK